jgi:hypothetical protein
MFRIEPAKLGGNHIGQSSAKVVLLGVTAEIGKRKYNEADFALGQGPDVEPAVVRPNDIADEHALTQQRHPEEQSAGDVQLSQREFGIQRAHYQASTPCAKLRRAATSPLLRLPAALPRGRKARAPRVPSQYLCVGAIDCPGFMRLGVCLRHPEGGLPMKGIVLPDSRSNPPEVKDKH